MDLSFHELRKCYGSQVVLTGLNASFENCRSLVLIGPSGGGKSTLLRMIAGLESADSGDVMLDGEKIPAQESALRRYREKLGIVFQAYNLFPHLTALENLMLPLGKVHGLGHAEAKERAMQCLERFRLEAHGQKRPAQLSGGQQQRVAIARAISIRPRLLLFDEPTSALDPEMTAEVLQVIEELRVAGTDFILVTHAMAFARRVADQVAFVAEGGIVEQGTPEEVFTRPRSEVCRAFLAKVERF